MSGFVFLCYTGWMILNEWYFHLFISLAVIHTLLNTTSSLTTLYFLHFITYSSLHTDNTLLLLMKTPSFLVLRSLGYSSSVIHSFPTAIWLANRGSLWRCRFKLFVMAVLPQTWLMPRPLVMSCGSNDSLLKRYPSWHLHIKIVT